MYDFFLRLYIEATVIQNLPKPQKYTTLKAPEPEPVRLPSLVSALILAMAGMGAALLGVEGFREVQKP